MQKRERSPDQMVDGPHLTKRFITNGRVHISLQALDSSDGPYGSGNSINGVTILDDEPQTSCTGCECHVPGCNQSFANMRDFEDHYTMCHRFVCRYCQCFYSTNHLLEIHLAENHDSFFSLLSQQQPMYKCLEESCKHHFMDAQSRRYHMTYYHGYPSNFHFDRRQHSRVVDMTGGLEENRDIGFKKTMPNSPPSTKVPEEVRFGIGGSDLFQSSGT